MHDEPRQFSHIVLCHIKEIFRIDFEKGHALSLDYKKINFTGLVLIIFFSVTIIVRLIHLDSIQFLGDEFTALILSYENIHKAPVLAGLQSSTGLYNPPIFIYLLSVATYFSIDPAKLTLYVILLNIAGLLLLFYFFYKHLGLIKSLIVSVIFSSSPWFINFSRKIWAQDVMLPFMALLYICIFSLLKEYKSYKVLIIFFLVAVLTQLHMSTWFLPVPLILFFLLFRIKFKMKDILMGFSVFITLYLPYIYYHFRTHFENVRLFLLNGDSGNHFGNNIIWSFKISTGLGYDYLLGVGGYARFLSDCPWIYAIIFMFIVYLFLTVAAFFYCSFKSLKTVVSGHFKLDQAKTSNEAKISLLFILIYLFTQALYLVFDVPGYPHYNILFYATLSFFVCLFLGDVTRSRNVLLSFTAIIFFVNIFFVLSFYHFVENSPKAIDGDYGIPYQFQKHEWENSINRTLNINP